MVATLLAAACLAVPFAAPSSLYDFARKDIDGKERKLSEFKGKVVLVVNVASKCGLTKQYAGIEALYRKYRDKGLVVLGFPANNFGGQEPGTEAEIKQFCKGTYDVTFPMFSKISVKGEDIDPLYSWLIGQSGKSDDIEWNFAKFVVGRDGKRVLRFSPKTTPEAPEFVAAIEKELAK